MKATYNQPQSRTTLTWDAQAAFNVQADVRATGTVAMRGSTVFDNSQLVGNTTYGQPGTPLSNPTWGFFPINTHSQSTWSKSGNLLVETNNSGGMVYYRPGANLTSYTFEFDVRVNGHQNDDDGIGIAWRIQDAQNYYAFYMCGRQNVSGNCGTIGAHGGATLRRRHSHLIRVRNGNAQRIDSWSVALGANSQFGWLQNTWYRMRVVVNGNTFTVSKRTGGTGAFTTLFTRTDNRAPTAGTAGTWSYSQPNQQYDNFGFNRGTWTQTRAITSAAQNAPINNAWRRMGTQTFTQLLTGPLATWRSFYGYGASQVSLPQVYANITNNATMYEAKASTNGTNTTANNPNSWPYGRSLASPADATRSYLQRNNANLPNMPLNNAFTYSDQYTACRSASRPNAATTYTYRVRTRNRAGQYGPYSANVSVTTRNAPPTFAGLGPYTRPKGSTFTLDVSAQINDPDAPKSTLVVSENSPLASVSGTRVTFTFPANFGPSSVTIPLTVTDCWGATATRNVLFRFPANRPPVISGTPPATATPGTAYGYKVTATDPEGGSLSYSFTASPPGATINSSTGQISWTPGPKDAGKTVTFTVRVCDNGSPSACATQTWTVKVANRPPQITSTPPTAGSPGTAYSYPVKATDPDGGTLSYKLKSSPTGATIDPKTGEIKWTPQAGDAGKSVPFEVEVCDDGTPPSCTTQKWSVTVTQSNRPPKITSAPPTSATTGKQLEYTPKAADPDGDTLTWSLDQGPAGAKVDPTTGKLTWTPGNADAGKPVTITIRVCDNGNPKLCDTQSFTLTPGQACKVDIDCAAPSICIGDGRGGLVCAPAGCTNQSPQCSKTTDTCKEGKCGANPCATKTCASGEICRPSDGKCIKSCAGVQCAADQTCVDGACQNDPCAKAGTGGGACAKDEYCDTSDAQNPKCAKNPCNAQSCRHGRICGGSRCIDDPCSAMSCPSGQRCQAGQCKDRQPCKLDGDCPNDQVCIGDRCVDPGCYTQSPKCPAANACRDATCKPNQCPTPGGTACKAGEFCRPVANQCVPTCAGVSCPAGERCVDGKCAKDPCAGVTCKAGEVCVNGTCEGDRCSGGAGCKHGRVCSKRSNRCTDDPCAGVTCPDAKQACVDGQCIQPGCRFDADCPADQICLNRQCVPTTCTQASDCKQGERCAEGKCVADPCEGKQCPSGQFCRNGSCVDTCAGIFCPAKQACVDGKCVTDPCAGVSCAADERCEAGTCVKDLCKAQTNPCRNGRLCRKDQCQDDRCGAVKCPSGESCSEGQCTGDKPCKVDVDCPGDGVCLEGKCAAPQCYKDGNCPAGERCLKARCAADPCANKQCASGQTCRPTDGQCVDHCPRCPNGERCKAGKCEADPCAGKQCAADESCDDSGSCVKDACVKDGDKNCRYKRVCRADKCADDPCANIQCPSGMSCNDGVCTRTSSSEVPPQEKGPEEGSNEGGNQEPSTSDAGGESTGDQPPSSSDSDQGDGPGSDTTSGDGGKGADEPGGPFIAGGGCGCSSAPGTPWGGLLLLLLALLIGLRRRTHQS